MAKDNKTIYYPESSLEDKFLAGELTDIEAHILEFVERHHETILNIAATLKENGIKHPYIEATQILVGKRGSIHLPSEMAALIKEINKEKWYRGEEGEDDGAKVKDDWTMKYAQAWRESRKIEILYVIEKKQDEVREQLFGFAKKLGLDYPKS